MAPFARALLQRGPHRGIALGRTEAHCDIFWTKDRLHPGVKKNGEIERWESTLADYHGMNKFNRNVLGIGGVRSATEGEKPSSTQEPVRHFATGMGQAHRLAREESLEDLVPPRRLSST